jgi:hypothetical protein
MSADKTIMVGTFSGPRTGEYALRVYQIVNPLNEDYSSPPAYDQSKPYNAQKVAVGPAVFSAHGVMELTNASSGVLSFSSYSDTIGGGMPADSYFTYTFIGNSNKTIAPALGAILTDPGSASYPPDPTFYGKVSRYSYLVAYTRTEANGDRSLTVGMQQPQ